MSFGKRSAFGKKVKSSASKPLIPGVETDELDTLAANAKCEMEESDERLCCTNPDLIILRKNAIGEREAIYFYTKAACKFSGSLRQLFTEVAQDEMRHFRNTMAVIAMLDPTQAHEFQDAGIILESPCTRAYTPPTDAYCEKCDTLTAIEYLTQAMADELAAINLYQQSIMQVQSRVAKRVLCDNMNDEKEHLAEFWAAISKYTKEDQISTTS